MSIVINCRKVYDSGTYYENVEDEIKSIKEKLLKIAEDIKENYQGPDSHNFAVSFTNHINQLNDIEEFLEDKAIILKDTALKHNSVDNEFIAKVERSVDDEL